MVLVTEQYSSPTPRNTAQHMKILTVCPETPSYVPLQMRLGNCFTFICTGAVSLSQSEFSMTILGDESDWAEDGYELLSTNPNHWYRIDFSVDSCWPHDVCMLFRHWKEIQLWFVDWLFSRNCIALFSLTLRFDGILDAGSSDKISRILLKYLTSRRTERLELKGKSWCIWIWSNCARNGMAIKCWVLSKRI